MQPVTPEGAGRLLDQLKIPATERDFAHICPEYALKPGTAINKPEGVFPRIAEDEEPQVAAG